MKKNYTILVADDDQSIRMVVQKAFERAGYDVLTYGTFSQAWTALQAKLGDLFLSDVMMPDADGLEMMPKVKQLRPDMPVIIMSAKNTLSTAVKASEMGAFDYLPKPFDINELVEMAEKALESKKAAASASIVRDDAPIIGRSPAMQKLYRIMARVIPTDLSVMLQGESGTGKELVARAIHDMGKRAEKPFVAVNMGAIPSELIESELFGHEKGAFTGAAAQSMGRFQEANGGTLFLDEIGDMPIEAQTRLLRVLQQGEYRRVGGSVVKKVDVRIISATHKDLPKMIENGDFREDLYFRLNVVPLSLPKLSERSEDIPELVSLFLDQAKSEGLPEKTISTTAIDILKAYHWPGNVRELKNLVQRLCVLTSESLINAQDVEHNLKQVKTNNDLDEFGGLSGLLEKFIQDYFDAHEDDLLPKNIYDVFLQEYERPLIKLALEKCQGNQLKTADLLGINRNTLRKKITNLGLNMSR